MSASRGPLALCSSRSTLRGAGAGEGVPWGGDAGAWPAAEHPCPALPCQDRPRKRRCRDKPPLGGAVAEDTAGEQATAAQAGTLSTWQPAHRGRPPWRPAWRRLCARGRRRSQGCGAPSRLPWPCTAAHSPALSIQAGASNTLLCAGPCGRCLLSWRRRVARRGRPSAALTWRPPTPRRPSRRRGWPRRWRCEARRLGRAPCPAQRRGW